MIQVRLCDGETEKLYLSCSCYPASVRTLLWHLHSHCGQQHQEIGRPLVDNLDPSNSRECENPMRRVQALLVDMVMRQIPQNVHNCLAY